MVTVAPVLAKWKKNKRGQSWILIRFTEERKRKYKSTGICVTEKQWDERKSEVKGTRLADSYNARISKKLNAIAQKRARMEFEGAMPTTADLMAAMDEDAPVPAPKTPPKILDEYARFKAEKEPRVRSNTLKIYTTIEHKLKAWVPADTDVTSIEPGWLTDFATYLIGTGLGNSTVNKLTARCGSFLRWMEAREVIGRSPAAKPLPEARNSVLYLTTDELRVLAELDLSQKPKGWQAARDLFLASACTGMRYGDLLQMRWDDLKGKWWHLTPEKTGEPLLVPLPTPVLRIIQTRKGMKTPLPRLSNQKANAYLKEICQLAQIDTPVTVTTLRGGNRARETWRKWQVVTMHAGRKTYITLSLKSGASISDLLNYTHSDVRALRAYIGEDEKARAEHAEKTFGGLRAS